MTEMSLLVNAWYGVYTQEMKLTPLQLEEARKLIMSERNRNAATKRWAKIPRNERLELAKRMNEAKKKKQLLT